MSVNIILPLACEIVFFNGRWFTEHHFSRLWSASKMFITLEKHGILESNFAYFFILTLFCPCFCNVVLSLLSSFAIILPGKRELIALLQTFEPRHETSNNVVCLTSKVLDQPAHTRSLIRAFASRLNIL